MHLHESLVSGLQMCIQRVKASVGQLVTFKEYAQIMCLRALTPKKVANQNQSFSELPLLLQVTMCTSLDIGVKFLKRLAPGVKDVAFELSVVGAQLTGEDLSEDATVFQVLDRIIVPQKVSLNDFLVLGQDQECLG